MRGSWSILPGLELSSEKPKAYPASSANRTVCSASATSAMVGAGATTVFLRRRTFWNIGRVESIMFADNCSPRGLKATACLPAVPGKQNTYTVHRFRAKWRPF